MFNPPVPVDGDGDGDDGGDAANYVEQDEFEEEGSLETLSD